MKIRITILLVFILNIGFAQNKEIDTLKHELSIATHDTSRVLIMARLCEASREHNIDSAFFYGNKGLTLAKQIHFIKGEIRNMAHLGRIQFDLGNVPRYLEIELKALRMAEENHLEREKMFPLNFIGNVYRRLSENQEAINFYRQAMIICESIQDRYASNMKMNIGNTYIELNQLDSAMYYLQTAQNEMQKIHSFVHPLVYLGIGNVYTRQNNYEQAFFNYQKGLQVAEKNKTPRFISTIYRSIANLYKEQNQRDSSIYYAKKSLELAESIGDKIISSLSSDLLSKIYENYDTKKAFDYYKKAVGLRDSLTGSGNVKTIQALFAQDEERQKEIENNKIAFRNQLKLYISLAILGISLLIGFILYRNNRQKHKANILLQEQKEKVESTLSQLKSTQTQLIQSEKLASLGELTAGIAHEIQNPLNFVNNFSELSVDLVKDLKDELKRPDKDETYIDELFDDLSQNQEKINLHGKRASNIVKGMLEHSRTSTGVKEPTDINKLADEYLRLSYHGLRAKDNSFNADFSTDFDENLPKIEVIPQDIGRVLLNLINNAFYAVNERQKLAASSNDYTPSVVVSTQHIDNQIIIKVADNGNGIPDNIKSKVFQPFFTTKPTGQGTGLGLSLAYDIVTKGHGGNLEVLSTEGVGSEFILTLNINS
jgi:two-component system, NtrC family, sensor kinase